MATPYVAGVAALYVSACKKAGKTPTPTEFRTILEASSLSNAPPPRPNPNSGFGRIQADKFVDFVTIIPPVTGEFTFTESDFTAAGLLKFQKTGLTKLSLTLKGTQTQSPPPDVVTPASKHGSDGQPAAGKNDGNAKPAAKVPV